MKRMLHKFVELWKGIQEEERKKRERGERVRQEFIPLFSVFKDRLREIDGEMSFHADVVYIRLREGVSTFSDHQYEYSYDGLCYFEGFLRSKEDKIAETRNNARKIVEAQKNRQKSAE